MSALAKWMHAKGSQVSGSDLTPSPLIDTLKDKGIQVHIGHDASHLPEQAQALVYSSAVPETNPERTEAATRDIPQYSYFEYLGKLSSEFTTIAVTGTHGKSTTTAMLGLILEAAGYDPTVLVGSLVPGFEEGNLRLGKGRFFVVEACEYRANMLHINPEMIVITNIDEDHLDYYRDLDHIRDTFAQFIDKLKGQGMVVLNANDPESKKLINDRSITFGTGGTYNQLNTSLKIPGEFNQENALAALAAATELGIPEKTSLHALSQFTGVWRRFEQVGSFQGATVISDYAHHPTEIKKTLKGAREMYPDKRIVLCFQPHQHDRTQQLKDGLIKAIQTADKLIVTEIYDVAGRNENHSISSKELTDQIKDSHFTKDLNEAEAQLRQEVNEGDLLIIMGAGDIDDLARKISRS